MNTMSILIKVSYERPGELQRIIDRLGPDIKATKISSNNQGRFKKAYIELKDKKESENLLDA
jgi:hypothetical protein